MRFMREKNFGLELSLYQADRALALLLGADRGIMDGQRGPDRSACLRSDLGLRLVAELIVNHCFESG